MLKIAIVEDNQAAAGRLKGFLEKYAVQYGMGFEVTVFEEAVNFLNCYRPCYDMVFMDIELPHMDGMTAARRLREMDQQIVLIFVTNMAQFAVKGYEVNALDYIVKPVAYSDFELKFGRAVARCRNASGSIMVVQQNGSKRILLRELRYIEVQGHKLIFHTEDGIFTGSGTLLEAEEKLREKGFLRCNKCYLVNQKHIAAIRGNTLVMSGGEELQISRLRKKTFMSELTECMGNENVL